MYGEIIRNYSSPREFNKIIYLIIIWRYIPRHTHNNNNFIMFNKDWRIDTLISILHK